MFELAAWVCGVLVLYVVVVLLGLLLLIEFWVVMLGLRLSLHGLGVYAVCV